MKKFIAMILALAIVTVCAGCNKAIGPGNYSFEKVHIDTHNYSGCLTIKKWHDNDTGIEVKTEEAGSLFLSEGTYILLDGDKPCPFCGD